MIKILLIAIVMSFSTVANARTPDQFLIDLISDARALQEIQDDAAVDYLILKLIKRNFDIQMMGKFVLGRYWRKASVRQQERFLELFQRVSVKRFKPMLKDLPLDSFRIISINNTDIDIIVISTIKFENKIIKVRWRLRRLHPGGIKLQDWPEYQVIDITAKGISLMLTLRAEYGSTIKQFGIDGLISRLENET